MKIKFIKQPTGRFNLAYSEGEEAILGESLSTELIEAGYAIEVESIIETAVSKEVVETPEKKKGKK